MLRHMEHTFNAAAVVETTRDRSHTLTVFNAVDVPDDVAGQIMALLSPYNPDTYTRACDANGYAS